MAVNSAKTLGYGGSGVIDGVQILITSGNIDTSTQVSYLQIKDIPPSTLSRSRVVHADGTSNYSANMSFDVTDDLLAIFTTASMFRRRNRFDISIYDGESGQTLSDCFMTNLSLTGAPGGLISGSMSVVSASAPAVDLTVTKDFIRDSSVPLGYWFSGNTDVRDWTFSINQDAQPVYGNENTVAPRYLRAGLWDMNLDVVTYDAIQAHDEISIKTKTFTITGNSINSGFNFNGPTDLGMYRHTFESGADIATGSGDTILTVT